MQSILSLPARLNSIVTLLFTTITLVVTFFSGPLSELASQEIPVGGGNAKQEIVKAKTFFSSEKLPAGKDSLIMVQVEILKGWHIYANPADPDFLYPVKLTTSSKGKITSTSVLYPKGANYIDPDTKDVYKVYEDKIDLVAKIKAPAELAGTEEELTVTVEYQACDQKRCLPPAKNKNVYKVKIANEGEELKPINTEYFNKQANH